MKVDVDVVRGVSMMYAMTVGKDEAKEESRICPDADQTKTSIWPGVSRRMWGIGCCGGCGSCDCGCDAASSALDSRASDSGGVIPHLFSRISRI